MGLHIFILCGMIRVYQLSLAQRLVPPSHPTPLPFAAVAQEGGVANLLNIYMRRSLGGVFFV